MKKLLAVIGLSVVSLTNMQSATIAQWTFETLTLSPAYTNSTSIFGVLPEVGSGTASGTHASALTVFSTPVGNGSPKSLSANNWAVGDFYQFSVATTGYEDLFVGWGETSSGTGPGEFKLAYQVNGGGFTDFFNYTVLPNQVTAPGLGSWTSGTEITGYNYLVDLSAITSLDNSAAVDFRLIVRSTADSTPPGTIAASGSSRVDNFTVTASLVPEPSALALAGLGMLILVGYRRSN